MEFEISGLMPGFLRKAKLVRTERGQLDGIATSSCDPLTLRAARDLDIDAIFNSAECRQAWEDAHDLLHRFPIVDGHGGVNPGDRRAIFYLIRALKPRAVLEIGTHVGASTLHIAAALSQLAPGLSSPPRFVTVDIADVNCPDTRPWQKCGTQFSPAQMMTEAGFDSFVRFVTSDSLGFFHRSDEKFDFIFLDGSHAATAVYQEIPVALGALNPGGVVLLHDYFPRNRPLWKSGALIPGPFLAIERLRTEGARIRVRALGILPWPTKENSTVTSLALLLRDD